MFNGVNRNKSLGVIIVLALIAAGVVLSVYEKRQKTVKPPQSQKKQELQVKVSQAQVLKEKLPEKFPEDFPMEKDAVILANYNSQNEQGNFQSTRQFESKKSLAESFKLYSDYLSKNGWQVIGVLNKTEVKSITAKKADGTFVTVSMSSNSLTRKNVVDISFVYPPAKK